VLAGLIAIGLWPRAIPVEVATVSRGPLVVTVDEEPYIGPVGEPALGVEAAADGKGIGV